MKKFVFYLCQLCVDTRLVKIIIILCKGSDRLPEKKNWNCVGTNSAKENINCAGVCNIATNKLRFSHWARWMKSLLWSLINFIKECFVLIIQEWVFVKSFTGSFLWHCVINVYIPAETKSIARPLWLVFEQKLGL